jgi:membrane fusion protein (multidrug efflux system)
VVPERAVQDLQGLDQLTVIGPDDKAEVRTVKLGPAWGSLRVVEKGVSAGERVVVEGFQKVRPGMQVVAQAAPAELSGSGPEPETPASVAAPADGTTQAAPPPARN